MSRDALVIGINLYNELQPLEKPVNDAEAVAHLLETQGGFRVKRLPLSAAQSIDEKGVLSFAELEKAICQLFAPETTDNLPDTALLFFAGHGLRRVMAGVADGYLATSDSDPNKHLYGLSLEWLKKVLQNSPIKQQIVWLDCCFSGELLNFDETALGNKEAYARCFIAASRDYEEAYESVSSKHGVLTEVLLQGLAAQHSVDNYDLADFIQTKLTSSVQKPLVRNFGRIILTQTITDLEKQPLSGECPYKGLRFFDEADAKYFHGREALTEQLIDAVRSSHFLAVLGVSGSGKSSVIRAGLLHQLRLGKHLGESRDWHLCKPFTPAQNERKPLENLAQALVDDDLPPATRLKELESVLHFLAKGAAGLQQLLDTIDAPRVVLVIDQFEELFTRCDEQDREQFLACILGVLPEPNATVDKLCVILTLRADFLGKCAEQDYSGLNTYLDAHRITVTPMTEAELSDAILKPAQAVGLEVEPELVTAMLQDVDAASLPLLEYSLWVLWEHRRVNRLTVEDYIRAGRVQGTLQQSADKAYADLSAEEQTVAQWIFLGLTQLGEGTEDTRKQVFKQELVTGRYAEEIVDNVLNKLVSARLVVVDSWDSRGDDKALVTVVDVTHEALIRHWGLLRQWTNDNRDLKRWKDDLAKDRLVWTRAGSQDDDLLRGFKLLQATEYLEKYRDKLNYEEVEFITASIQLQAQQEAIQKQQQIRRNRLTIGALITAVIFVIGLAGFGLYADSQRVEIEQQKQAKEIALEQAKKSEQQATKQAEMLFLEKLAAQSTLAAQLPNTTNGYYEHALLLAVQIFKEKNNATTRSNLLRVLQSQQQHQRLLYGHTDQIYSMAFSPNNQVLASGSWDNTVRLWDVATGQTLGQPLTGHSSSVISVAFSPDGKTLASGSVDNTVRLWDVETRKPLGQPLTAHTHTIYKTIFSPDGKTLASASRDKTIRLWDVATRKPLGQPLTGHSDTVTNIIFSADGKILTSESKDNTIRHWDVATGQALNQSLNGRSRYITHSAFTPDGKTLAFGGRENLSVSLWNVETGQALGQPLSKHTSVISGLAFSPDGKTLASGSWDKTVILWDMKTGQALGQPLRGHSHYVTSVVFNSDGKALASGSSDNTIRLWDMMPQPTLLGQTFKSSDFISNITISSDGQTLASGSMDGTIHMWDTTTGQALGQPLVGHTDSVNSVAFSPDGKILASGGSDNTIKLWDVATRQVLDLPVMKHTNFILSMTFSPDGKTLASGGGDNTIKLWDVETGQALDLPLMEHAAYVFSVVFSPDGKILASAGGDKIIKLWDAATGQSLAQPFKGHLRGIHKIAFSPDGALLASSSGDSTIRLWDVATGQSEGQPLKGHFSAVLSVAFSPDGNTLVSAGDDSMIRLWDVETRQALGQPFRGNLSYVTDVSFMPDGKSIASSSYNTVQLWNVDLESWVKKACTIANRNFSHQEWQKYMGNRPHEKTCPDFPKDTLGAIELAEEARKLLREDKTEQAKAKFQQAREWDESVVWGDEAL
ncbi:caspase family protein [Candidatus Albibeggiatoa sp. nov. NOAA]|uniref:nSTAND1 domain-containing NTPase n=1 Tax=Candidatus Albibeggiatoa sp. nov. NOAA TaxID=3162724 RepID=UPI0032F4E929|nr:caspase family protein [Thiotrichaceae bacterium]